MSLMQAVVRKLAYEPNLRSIDIAVRASQGVVALTGFVHTDRERRAAGRAAKSVPGVLAVANDIEVKPGEGSSDPEIARAVLETFGYHVSVPEKQVKVNVRDGALTLEGTVERAFQRETAEALARSVPGVRTIVNHIHVRPA